MMRQAGRYLPEYRKLREKHSLKELFFTPELAAQITHLPIDLIGFDAAILFSDITVTALSLGLSLDFNEGPVVAPLLTPHHVGSLTCCAPEEHLSPIRQTIEILKQDLTVPLIGFCGGPFTVASYLIEKHKGQELPQTKKWLYQDPESFAVLLQKITDVSIDYLQMQEQAGIDAIQIFDSWAHVLSQKQFQQFVVPYVKQLQEAVRVPVILFMRGACLRIDELAALQPAAISFDWPCELSQLRAKVPQNIAVQGNLDPDLLYAPLPEIRRQTKRLVDSMQNDPGFIVNLGHGVKPDMPVSAVRCLVDTVKGLVL